jgi:hypothetical protein
VELFFGIALMCLGIAFFIAGRIKSKNVRVEASNGSVAIGGRNSGPITNTTISAQPAVTHGSHWLTILSIVVELAGMAVVFWHAWHVAAK